MNELDPKVQKLIKEHQEAKSKALKLRAKRNTWIVRLKEKFSYKQLAIYFKLSERRIKQIIKTLRKKF